MSQHILPNSDIRRQFILTTDASNEGMGKGLPVVYTSRNLNILEKIFSISEKEFWQWFGE
jgi:hypothetical protein